MSVVSRLVDFGQRHVARGIGRASNLVVQSARGAWVTTIDGKRYLDFTTGIGVVNTGKIVTM